MGRAVRGVLVCSVPECHEHGQRDIVREITSHGHGHGHGHGFFLIVFLQMTLSDAHLDDLLAVFSPLVVASSV